MTTEGRELVKRRQKWLGKRKMLIREFAEATRLDYNCVVRWMNEPITPQRMLRERVSQVFPDFPIRP